MLRESSQTHAQEVQLSAVMTGESAGDIKYGAQLVAFAESVVGGDLRAIASVRDALVNAAGADVMIDAAGVASNFQRMVRIADSTGIALGDFEAVTADLRDELGINDFATRKTA